MSVADLVQWNGRALPFHFSSLSRDRGLQAAHAVEAAAPDGLLGDQRDQRSTRLSHDGCVGWVGEGYERSLGADRT